MKLCVVYEIIAACIILCFVLCMYVWYGGQVGISTNHALFQLWAFS